MAEERLAIDVEGLEKAYGEVSVLRGVDLRVRRGSIFALLGANGAGKTTAVRILTTLTRADRGRVRVAGFDVAHERSEVRRRISLTGQFAALDGLQTGFENLLMMGRLAGLSGSAARERAGLLLAQFDLVEASRRRVDTYSGGMRRRLDLAASLVGRPEIIFLDEPTTGLDLPSRQAMWATIARLVGTGVTIFVTTQYLEEADRLADRIAVIADGRVVADGSPADLKRQIGGTRLELVAHDAAAFARIGTILGARASERDERSLTLDVATDGSAAGMRALLDEVDPQRTLVSRFAVRDTTLDDVFLVLTGRGAGQAAQEVSNV